MSVLIIKGARDSAREHKEPQLRLGYSELLVENLRERLAVTLAANSDAVASAASQSPAAAAASTPPTFRPGTQVSLTGTVTLPDGSPAANAEVTLYAEDEGTLAVMGYDTPDPMAYFYAPVSSRWRPAPRLPPSLRKTRRCRVSSTKVSSSAAAATSASSPI